MLELFDHAFMRRALVAGTLVGGLASWLGVFVVQRKLSFLGNGLSHAAFGGVALGILLGVEPIWVAAPFTAAVALGIVFVERRTNLAGDTAVGVFFAVSMALGIVFLSLRRDANADAMAYLFGSILALRDSDVAVAAAAALPCVFASRVWGRWAYATFDRDLALADRLPVARDDYALSVAVAVAVVVSIKIVGIVLLAAFLVIPAATARLVSPTFARMTLISVALGSGSVFAGLLVSYALDLPTGATIVLLQAAAFVAGAGWSR